jgi:hypothetical protein
MTLASGLGSQFGLTKESTYGTQLAATKFFEIDSAALALDQTYQDGVGLRANRMYGPSGRMRATVRTAGGAVPMDVPTKGFGSILDLMHGLTPTVVQQGATTAWLQTHTIGTSMPTKFATLQVNKPTSQAADTPTTYPGSILTAASFSLSVDGMLKCTTTWDSMDERTLATTPAGLALATATYTTGVTSWLGAIGASVTLAGSAVANGLQTTTGTMDLEWFDTAAYTLFRSGAKVALVFSFTNDVISGAFSEQIVFSLSAIQIRGTSPDIAGPDVLDMSVPFVAGDNGSTAPLIVTYMSTDTAI